MPNYIKNRIELIGAAEDIAAMIERFSTSFERTPSLAHNGELIYLHKETGEPGWFNEKTGKFSRRGIADSDSIHEDFVQKFEEAWSRFPDFNKIIPMPVGLEANPHSGIQIWIEICTGQVDFKDTGDSQSFDGLMGSMKKVAAIRTLTEGKSVKQFSDEEFELFIQGVKNYRQYGFMSWYEWSIQNWGTKWNSSDCEKISENTFDFITAWSGVPNIIETMSKACPNVKIIYKYSDEDTGHNCGIGEYQNGELYFHELEGGSKEAYDMAFELRPDRKENYQLVGDKYEYVETE